MSKSNSSLYEAILTTALDMQAHSRKLGQLSTLNKRDIYPTFRPFSR
jgi:hypothetical protein